jgi:two-component system, response regulator PdtaR
MASMVAVEVAVVPDKPTVLVVEDDEVLVRLMIADELREQGLHVLEASNADDALTNLQSSLPVDLLFTDVRMPGRMDGVALARFAHSRFPWLKLMMASGGRPEEPVRDVADVFLCKPYDLDKMIEHVERLLAQPGNDR